MLEELIGDVSLSTVLVFLVTLAISRYVFSLPRVCNLPPGPFPLPILGNFFLVANPNLAILDLVADLKKKYGKLFFLRIGEMNLLVISDLEVLISAYVHNDKVFSNRPHEHLYMVKKMESETGLGIFLSDGSKWSELRRTSVMAMRDFGVGKKTLEEKINEEVRVVLDVVEKQGGQALNIRQLMMRATSNVICNVIFGDRFEHNDPKFLELLDVISTGVQVNPLFTPVNFFPFLRFIPSVKKDVDKFMWMFKKIDGYIKTLTVDHEETFDPEQIRDLVDLTIKMRNSGGGQGHLSAENMRRVIIDLFNAGSDTTANTLTWAMIYMVAYPEVQAKCQKELSEVLGKDRIVTLADRHKLKYTEATILEVLRVRPVAPLGVPHCVAKDTKLCGYNIPAHTVVLTNFFNIQHDPKYWQEPEVFKPERFLDSDGNIINREKVVAFSVGPRTCMGESLARMELSLFFASILQFYEVQPETPGVKMDLNYDMGVVLNPRVQKLKFVKRFN